MKRERYGPLKEKRGVRASPPHEEKSSKRERPTPFQEREREVGGKKKWLNTEDDRANKDNAWKDWLLQFCIESYSI